MLHYSSDPPSLRVLQASAAILRTTLPVCHVTPYASRLKLNTDIGIIQLATRILGSGIQRRPRMTTQRHNLNVCTRKLSQDFRSGRTTTVVRPGFRRPLPHALSTRSRTHFPGGGSGCTFAPVIVTGAWGKDAALGLNDRLRCSRRFGLVRGGSCPQWRGHDCRFTPLIRSACGSFCSPSHSVCVHTNTD